MKNIVFFILLLFSSCATIQKGETSKEVKVPEYISLEEFKGDTISYMIQSFYERKDYYIGKKVKVFIKDLEIEISEQKPKTNVRNALITPGVMLFLGDERNYSFEDTKENKPLIFTIKFESPPQREPILKLGKSGDNWKWTKEEYKFYKDLIIKDIGIPKYGVFKSYFE